MGVTNNIKQLKISIPETITLVAVSKTKPTQDILKAYKAGHKDFGENKVQELVKKHENLPKDIKWHMIGHLQRNKVKYIAPFINLIHTVDSIKLMREINKRANENNRNINCLLQIHIAKESTKFGFLPEEVDRAMTNAQNLKNINIKGLMGMATFTTNTTQLDQEFSLINDLFNKIKNENINTLSIGMSADYKLAIRNGSTMVRIGSAIFGVR